MNPKTFFSIAGGIFWGVAVMHAVRVWRGWEVVIGGWSAPLWLSALAAVIAGALAFTAFRLRRVS